MGFSVNRSGAGIRDGGNDSPLSRVNETMSTAENNNSSAFRCRGDGTISVVVSCVDDTSADGEFYIQVGDSATGTFSTLSVPILSKIAGAALDAVQMLVDKPGASWARVRYVRTTGGAPGEVSLEISTW